MSFLTPRERRALQAICDTFIPELDDLPDKPTLARFSPAKNGFLDDLEQVFERITDDAAKTELKLLLNAFETSVFNGVMSGEWSAFSQMPRANRERVLRAWGESALFLRRKAFQGLKRVILFVAYTNPHDGSDHPLWREIGYSGKPQRGTPSPDTLQPYRITHDTTLTTDVLIIGSGAGGGVVAGELSAAGYEVLVVEKGGFYTEADFDGNERRANETLFEKYGSLTTADTSIMVLAGATLGGGTVVNWSASFRTPDYVLEEWARDYGFSDATSAAYKAGFDAVIQASHIDSDESHLNSNNARFEQGCKALGYAVDVIPRNVKGCEDCGFCGFGCSFGAKQSTAKTYLQQAYQRGARILVNAYTERVTHANGIANGALLKVTGADGNIYTVTVNAKRVVVSAGALHTPALLRRSGLTNPHIGANLRLHPTTVVFSLYDDPVRMWQGVPMSRVAKQFMNLDGKGYGVALEVAPAHPGLTAATLPWVGGTAHKRLVGQMAHMANALAITRDAHGGYIKLDKHGQPIIDYRLHPYDRAHLQRGVLELLKIHRASAPREVFSPHNAMLRYVNDGTHDFDAFLARVEKAGLAANAFPLFSAHQMASCRIAGSPTLGALAPNGESYEVKNLYVADGSALPTATGVNPMVSIMTLAYHVAQGMKS